MYSKLTQNIRCKEVCLQATFLSHCIKVLFFGNEMIDDLRLFCSSFWPVRQIDGREVSEAGQRLSATYGLCQYQM